MAAYIEKFTNEYDHMKKAFDYYMLAANNGDLDAHNQFRVTNCRCTKRCSGLKYTVNSFCWLPCPISASLNFFFRMELQKSDRVNFFTNFFLTCKSCNYPLLIFLLNTNACFELFGESTFFLRIFEVAKLDHFFYM